MSTTTETASHAAPTEPAEANPTGTPVATLAAKNERRRSLFTSSYPVIMLIALAILLGVTYLSLITGRYPVELDDLFRILGKNWFGMDLKVYKPAENMLLTVRIPRLLAAGLIGAALAIAGATFQAVFRNPLVSPYLLGVSQGASVGAASAILLGVGTSLAIQGSALAGGLAAVLLTVSIPRLLKNQSTLMLVLSGVIVGGFGTAALGALKFIANPETQLAQIVFWQMGSLQDVRAEALTQFALVAVPCILLLLAMRWRINILSLGDDEARTLGINLPRTRGVTILLATLVTATSVCIGGPISWVGLVIPHLCRLLVGSDTTKLMPLSILMGASFMMFVDTLARSLTSAEVPLSVLTGFIGTPLYVALLLFGKVRVK
ncbi:iron ABC transporter permease [uncultured Rothia sp.]|uniref:FecCD family ABC transporter permease n=1 Tax=uncultured Rothia sp. TaxID=316088 RepID=UPI002610859C|nr:iron ABC transporter permease [uncultured Rothia sp.]